MSVCVNCSISIEGLSYGEYREGNLDNLNISITPNDETPGFIDLDFEIKQIPVKITLNPADLDKAIKVCAIALEDE